MFAFLSDAEGMNLCVAEISMELKIVNDLTKNLSVKKNKQTKCFNSVNFSEMHFYLSSICFKNIS